MILKIYFAKEVFFTKIKRILLFSLSLAFLIMLYACGSSEDKTSTEAKQEISDANAHNSFVVTPEFDIENEDGTHITGAVLVIDGQPRVLNENEYLSLLNPEFAE